jgi:hypothetical protein
MVGQVAYHSGCWVCSRIGDVVRGELYRAGVDCAEECLAEGELGHGGLVGCRVTAG